MSDRFKLSPVIEETSVIYRIEKCCRVDSVDLVYRPVYKLVL